MRAFKTPTLLWLLLAVVAEHGRGQLLELPSLQPLANNFATAQRNSNANNAHPPNANEGKDAPPCTSTRYAANPLVLPESLCSFMGNRPPGERCKLPLRVTLPETCRDPSLLRSAPVVILISGFGVKAQAYNTLVGDLSRWGYVVIQYERDLPNVAPPNDVENQYIEHLFSWLDDQRENATAPLYGRLSQNVTIAGHSMGGGLASMAAGSHRHRVDTAILFDPVDFSFLDDHVSKVYLKKFGKPVLIFTVGVRCMDRTGCLPPTSSAELTMKEPARPCAPSWWCCDWDSRTAAPMTSMGLGMGLSTLHGGPNSFVQEAPEGSWVATIKDAGHMSFIDSKQSEDPDIIIQCPATVPSSQLLPLISHVMLTWAQNRVRGYAPKAFLEWYSSTSDKPTDLTMKFL